MKTKQITIFDGGLLAGLIVVAIKWVWRAESRSCVLLYRGALDIYWRVSSGENRTMLSSSSTKEGCLL